MNLEPIIEIILKQQSLTPPSRSTLAGISGIDASGKGFITARLAENLEQRGFRVANLNADGWLNLPQVRFAANDGARNFYENALRLDEMFEKLVLPLKEKREVSCTADFAEETADRFRRREYAFQNIDIILLEGIFLFKNEYKTHFDLRFWIECFFETALERAVRRGQENLSPEETVKAYETIYFPAQKIHFRTDDPQGAADLIWFNN